MASRKISIPHRGNVEQHLVDICIICPKYRLVKIHFNDSDKRQSKKRQTEIIEYRF